MYRAIALSSTVCFGTMVCCADVIIDFIAVNPWIDLRYTVSRNYPRNQNPAHHCLSATCLPQKDFLQSSYYLGVCSNMVCAMFVFVFVPIYEFKVKKYNFNLISQNKIVFFEFEFINRDIIPISANFINFSLLLLQHKLQFAHIGPPSG